MSSPNRRVLPGFPVSLGLTLSYLTVLLLIPLLACFARNLELSGEEFLSAVWSARAQAAYWLTVWTSLAAAGSSAILGTLIAWVFVRYEFPLKSAFDALIDLPFALPTAVAGLVFSTLYVPSGWLGRFLVPLGLELAYTRAAIVFVMVFLGFPFVVRTLQPVLESLDKEIEEAAAMLGSNRWQTFRRVIFPSLLPAIVTGFALAFARALGEYGSVVFVSSNIPGKSEIAAVMVVNKLEEFKYDEATAVATVLLLASFLMLILVNGLERWSRQWDRV
jgi:sulfate transport system permease protein